MTELQKVQDQLNKALAELMKVNLDENELLYDYIFEAHRLVKKLIIPDVSQQREPLLAYHKHLDSFNDPTIYNASESMIDDYLANNCG